MPVITNGSYQLCAPTKEENIHDSTCPVKLEIQGIMAQKQKTTYVYKAYDIHHGTRYYCALS